MGRTPRKSCIINLWVLPHFHVLGFIHGVQCKVAVNSVCSAASTLVSAQASNPNPCARKPPRQKHPVQAFLKAHPPQASSKTCKPLPGFSNFMGTLR